MKCLFYILLCCFCACNSISAFAELEYDDVDSVKTVYFVVPDSDSYDMSINYYRLLHDYGPFGRMVRVEARNDDSEQPDDNRPEINFNFKYVIYTIIGVIVIVIVIIILRSVNFSNIHLRRKKKHADDNDITTIEFESELQRALRDCNYKEAIRIVYLDVLNEFDEKQIVHWAKDKTPYEYIYELRDAKLKPLFTQLTNIFLEARFDNVVVDVNMYEGASVCKNDIMQLLNQSLTPKK